MKRKSLLFVLLMALFAPLAMHAQTLTVYEEPTTTNEYVPFYGYYADATQRNQMIFPATELTEMVGKEITQMVFYIDSYSGSGNIGNWIVSLGETTATTLSGIDNTTSLTEVYSGAMSFNSEETLMTVTFAEGYTYNGQNLLVEFNHPVTAGYKHYYFSGVDAEGASYCYSGQRNFLPEVTFTYQAPPACPKPTGVTATDLTAHGATVSWTGSSDSYILMLGQPSTLANYDFESNSIPAAFTNSASYPWTVVANTHSGAYCVKSGNNGVSSSTSDLVLEVTLANAGSVNFSAMASSESNWDWGRFLIDGTQQFQTSGTSNSWTDYSFDLAAGTHTLTWRYYKDGSGNNGDDCFYVDDIVINENPSSWDETHTASASPYTFTDLDPETSYLVMVKGVCGSEQSEPSAAVSFTTLESCATPQNLAVTTDGRTATATWTGAEGTCNIDINGTVTNNVTSPYTFNVDLSTTYTVKVQANCDGGETSDWTNPVSVTTPPCLGGHVIVFDLVDSYGDGWNGNAILVKDACDVIETLTIDNGTSNSGTLTLCDGDYYQLTWQTGNYAGETSFTLTIDGTTIFTNQSGSNLSNGQVLYTIGTAPTMPAKPTALTAGTPGAQSVELSWTENGDATTWQICVNNDEDNPIDVRENPYTLTGLTPDTEYTVKVRAINGTESCWSDEVTFTTAEACAKPTDLAEDDITTNSATLSWEGTSDSYVLQYRPWHQVGEDQVATGVLTPYTFDLSEYRGTGSVAIRHYDVSDMFQLNVDDIVVTNANGETVYTEDFEDGVVPSNISNMDLDGDGYVWGIRSNGTDGNGNDYCNGSYCASSASWDGVALYPDNWMIISGIEMGGQITFIARGQDPEWAAENFAVYVSAESDVVEETVTETTYAASNLEPNTPYAWQVKSDCGDFQSNWVSSFFKTKDDALVFAYEGDWDDLENWEDAEGNAATALPTLNNNVRIDADAEIPAGVVAQANKITIGEGSITVKDGGQLKQSSATVKVTMEKEITAYGESEGNYYFIASPFSGRTLYGDSDWNHVENMLTGEYDLYAFDPTEELEWINYKSSPTHISFQSTNGNAGLMGGEGYLYANQDGTTIMFVGSTGKSNNYIETKDFTFDGASADDFNGWALVGNFFSCNAYINYVDADGTALEADFYTLNNDNTYSLMSSNQPLPPCTGALMNVNATGKIQYATEAPATSKRTGMINMSLTQGRGNIDQVRIRFGQGHNLQHMSFRNSSKLYMTQDSKDYAVVYAENEGEMPVSFKADHNGTYTLSINTEDVEFGYLHLIDNLTGNDVDLLSTPSYSFEASTTDYASRFRLVFNANSNNDSFAFFNNGNWVITNEGDATLQVVDVMGRIISSETINGNANISINAAQGVYMLRLVNGENVKVQKVVVR